MLYYYLSTDTMNVKESMKRKLKHINPNSEAHMY